jgi:hypothetical protein
MKKYKDPCASTMKMHDKVEVYPKFIGLTPDDAESSVSCPGILTPSKEPPKTHRKGMGGPIGVRHCRNQTNLCLCQKWNSLPVRLIT